MKLLLNWLILTLAILITAYLLPGVIVSGFVAALIAALVLGIINSFIKPVLIILTLPINVLTLGLFTLVINAGLVMLTASLVEGFEVKNFWWAILFGLVLSIVGSVLNQLKKD